MKARLAMVLSAAGVSAAGTAAALVNTEVLRDDGGAPVTAPAPPTTSAAPTMFAATEPSTSSSPTTTTSPATTGSTVAQSSTPTSAPIIPSLPAPSPPAKSNSGTPVSGSATQQQFQLGDAATAILDTANGQLTIVTVAPHPGWELDRAEQDDATTVAIRLRSARGDVRFEASLVGGVVVVSLRTDDDAASESPEPDDDHDDNSGSSGSGSGSSGSGSGSGSSGSGSDDD